MSSNQSAYLVSVFSHPSEFQGLLNGLEPRHSNIVYAHAKMLGTNNAAPAPTAGVWIFCTKRGTPTVEFVLSCTKGPLGNYPIFIYTPLPSNRLVATFIQPRMHAIVDTLRAQVAPERVFSVFALDAVADAFAMTWTAATRVPLALEPVYYHAKFMHCDRSTFNAGGPQGPGYVPNILRPAVAEDVRQVASLCRAFAEASEPFILSQEHAFQEATLLIQANAVWVHTIQGPGGAAEIACIVVATRTTETVAAITKVYTNPKWRSRGCAERLVRFVCDILLMTKKSVVLYVAHNNPAAAKVYRRVGFVGYAPPGSGFSDSWKELGFDRGMVQLGHW